MNSSMFIFDSCGDGGIEGPYYIIIFVFDSCGGEEEMVE